MTSKYKFDLSFIIVTYNGGHLLRDCLRTLFEHTAGFTYEVIVIDNGSRPGTIKPVVDEFAGVKFLRNEENLGFSESNNIASKSAEGKYLVLCNDDVIFIENVVKKLFDFAEEQKGRLVIGPKVLNMDKSLQVSIGKFDDLRYIITTNFFLYKLMPRSKFLNKYYLNYLDFKEPEEVDFVKGCFLLIRAEDYGSLGGFDERFRFYGDETDLCYRFKESGGKVIYYPEAEVIHIGGAVTRDLPWFKYKHQTLSKIMMYYKLFSLPVFLLAVLTHYIGLLIRVPVYLLGGLFSFNKTLIMKAWFYLKQFFVFPKKLSGGKGD